MSKSKRGFLLSSDPSAILFRLIITSILLLLLVACFEKPVTMSLLPLYRAMFELITGEYRILFLGVTLEGADTVIRLDVALPHAIAVAGHLVMANPDSVASASTMTANIFHSITTGMIAIMAWPAVSWRIVIVRSIILVVLCLTETLLNIPLLLSGELWGVFLDNLAPESWSPLTAWADFLQRGGRFSIGLIAAIACIAIAEYTESKNGNMVQTQSNANQ